jgi:integrase
MKGYFQQRGKNKWEITVSLGRDPVNTGKYLRHTETLHGTRSQAQARVRQLLVDLGKGVQPQPGRVLVADLLRRWLAGYVSNKCSRRTQEGYESVVKHHLIPGLGNIPLRKLTAQQVNEYLSRAQKEGHAKGKGALSQRTVHHHFRILSEALRYGVKHGLIGRNVCEMADPPRPRKKVMRTLTVEEVSALLKAAKGTDLYPLIFTALRSGLRQGELLALRWRDLNLDLLSLSVCQTLYKRNGLCELKEPKSEHSRRKVDMTPVLGLFLREYRAEQEARQFGLTLKPDDLVFANMNGNPLDPGTVTHQFSRMARRAGLEGLRFHDLRHSFASLMLLGGVNPKTVSEALGHASPAFTLQVYSHILPGIQKAAMARLDEVLGAEVA